LIEPPNVVRARLPSLAILCCPQNEKPSGTGRRSSPDHCSRSALTLETRKGPLYRVTRFKTDYVDATTS